MVVLIRNSTTALNENGEVVHYGSSPQDYLQDVIRGKAVDFIRTQCRKRRPITVLHVAGHILTA